jgi:hypothetical protein
MRPRLFPGPGDRDGRDDQFRQRLSLMNQIVRGDRRRVRPAGLPSRRGKEIVRIEAAALAGYAGDLKPMRAGRRFR